MLFFIFICFCPRPSQMFFCTFWGLFYQVQTSQLMQLCHDYIIKIQTVHNCILTDKSMYLCMYREFEAGLWLEMCKDLQYSAVVTNLKTASEFIQISWSWHVKGELSCMSCYHSQFHHYLCPEPDRHHRAGGWNVIWDSTGATYG